MAFRAPSFRRRSRPSISPDKIAPYSVIPVTEDMRHRPDGVHIVPRRDLYAPGGPFIQPVTTGPSRMLGDVFDDDDDDTEPEIRKTLFRPTGFSSAGKKRTRQWEAWKTNIIPQLIVPYLRVLHESQSLRLMDSCEEVDCDCGTGQRKLTVTCVYFDRKQNKSPSPNQYN